MIKDFKIFRWPVALGRVIGDNSCAYDQFSVVGICLRSSDGHEAWGYGEAQTHGVFARDAFWIRPLPELAKLETIFRAEWWPSLQDHDVVDLTDVRQAPYKSEPPLDNAVRLALWDLQAQQAGLPLYRVLNPESTRDRCKAYGSPLDFPLTDEAATGVVGTMLAKGITDIKVKVGAADPARDIARLQLVRSLMGAQGELAADANEAWDWPTALRRLEQFAAAGVSLAYIEDPLPRRDFAGLRELTRRAPTKVFGHDYLNQLDDMERLVDAGVAGIRTNGDFDFMSGCIRLARKHSLPVSVGNSLFEVCVHMAVGCDEVQRIEYSGLGWNDLIRQPVQIAGGFAYAPHRSGHGLVPTPVL